MDHTVLDGMLDGPLRGQAVHDVRRYFSTFTGRRFERFDGGGDRPEVADVVMAADVVAVSMLSIRWTGEAALELLETRRDDLSGLLDAVPHDSIERVPRETLAVGGPADRVWRLLRGIDDIGPTIAGKVLSRKRPHLVPVFDTVVHRLLGSPVGYWFWWHDWFSRPGRAEGVRGFRDEVGGIDDISVLRCLDVALWMHARRTGAAMSEIVSVVP